jgi:hypothetical protein
VNGDKDQGKRGKGEKGETVFYHDINTPAYSYNTDQYIQIDESLFMTSIVLCFCVLPRSLFSFHTPSFSQQ